MESGWAAGGWVLRVVGLSGGLGLITGVKKNFKKNTPGCSPHIRPPLEHIIGLQSHIVTGIDGSVILSKSTFEQFYRIF